jgi:hypothetical protein
MFTMVSFSLRSDRDGSARGVLLVRRYKPSSLEHVLRACSRMNKTMRQRQSSLRSSASKSLFVPGHSCVARPKPMREVIPARPQANLDRAARIRAAQLATARAALACLVFLLLCFLCAIARGRDSLVADVNQFSGVPESPHPPAASPTRH